MNLERLKEEQTRLARKIITKDSFSELSTVAGAEIIYTPDKMVATVVVLDYKTLSPIEKKHIVLSPAFPYIPSFLSYREIPAIIEVVSHLVNKPDLIFYQGNGILHQKKFGCACHLGLLLDLPTIGVSKKPGMGEVRSDFIYVDKEKRGYVLRTKDYAKPIIISPGHKVSLTTSIDLVKHTLKAGKKLPEPLRLVHNYAVFVKNSLKTGVFLDEPFAFSESQLHDAQ